MWTAKAGGVPNRIAAGAGPVKLEVNVIYTDCRSTLSALEDAARLASSMNARVRIVLPVVLPYPLGLDEPQVCESFHRRRLMTVADMCRVETVAEIIYCHEYTDLHRAIRPHSIVVIGEPRPRWWRWSASGALWRALDAGGYHIISVTDKEDSRA